MKVGKYLAPMMRIWKVVGLLSAVLALSACGSGGGSDDVSPAPGNNQAPQSGGYTLRAGETAASGLNLSMIAGKKFYWAEEGTRYGAISFDASTTGSGSGAAAVSAPVPTSATTEWDAAVIGTAMPILVSDGATISTYNIVAVATDYYVVSWTVANTAGKKYVRWYFSATAPTQAAAFAGNPTVTTQSGFFKTSDFSGRTLYWVGRGYYQKAVFYANGLLYATDSTTTGVPGNLRYLGTWRIADGALQILETSGATTYTTTYTYNATVNMSIPLSNAFYFRVIRDNGAINAFVYEADETKELAAAMALALVGGAK